MQHTHYPQGSVSSGTMLERDLIPDFCYTLRQYANDKHCGDVPAKRRQEILHEVEEIEARCSADKDDSYYHSDEAGCDLNEFLFDALQEFAGPYWYFGSHPGDGCDYGFWLNEESLQEAIEDKDVCRGESYEDAPIGCNVYLEVNDHGNMTLYRRSGKTWVEVWSVV